MTGREQGGRLDHSIGSPAPGEPVFLVVGKLRRPHGVRGELLMEVITDFPERLHPGVDVYIGDAHQLLSIRSCRPHQIHLLISFEGYDDLEAVGIFRNQLVYVRADDRPPLPKGEYYHHQLLGLSVVAEGGRYLGRLSQILQTGANDVFVVESDDGGEILLPAIEPVIRKIDLDHQEILVHLLPGLIPEE